MRVLFFTFILATLCVQAALGTSMVAAITPLEADTMQARVLITNTVTFEQAGPQYRVSEAQGSLTWFPRENRLQQVNTLEVDPVAERNPDSLVFRWTNPAMTQDIALTSTITTRNAIVPVRNKVSFPLRDVPQEMEEYLVPGEITDETPQIRALAQQLASGNDDAYQVVYNLADWTTMNVQYSLASLGQPASQKSSQVLQSRQGKCDELTSLFISLNRAVGIPARFVAGYSYTNSDKFKERWGGHGWAEVWLPGQGWIPFDVTYGEYGYLDAGHVTLKVSPDAKETSIDYSATGRDFTLRTQPLDITVTPTELTARNNPAISVSLETPYSDVGFGSAVLILATVENTRDYYVSTRLDLAKTTNTDMLSGTYKNILLKPRERRTLPFLVRIDDNLEQGYFYTFPFKAYSRLGDDATITINAKQNNQVYDASAYQQMIERYTQDSPEEQDFSVTCEQSVAYANNEATHRCTVTNATVAREMIICEKICTTMPLEKNTFLLITTDTKPGIATRAYTGRIGKMTTKFFVTSRTLAASNIGIAIQAPDTATPNDMVQVTVKVNHTGALPKNVRIEFHAAHSDAENKLDDLSVPAAITFSLPGRALRPGKNPISVTVTGVDELGTPLVANQETSITLNDIGLLDRVQFWIEDAGYWLLKVFS